MKSKVRRGIGLVAHDAMKKDLIEWVLWNSELLMGNKFYCTGTTGTLILEALKEKHPDEEWDFTILKSGPISSPLFMDPDYERIHPDYSSYTKRFQNKPVVTEAVESVNRRKKKRK